MRVCEWLERKGNHRCNATIYSHDQGEMEKQAGKARMGRKKGVRGGLKEGCMRVCEWLERKGSHRCNAAI